MAVTLEDVGRKCGVSRSTVSRVINDSPLVNQRTKDMVQRAIKEMKYAPNFIARSLTRNKTETIAVTLPDIAGGVFPEILAGMDEIASRHGYHVLVVFLGGARPHTATIEKLIRNRRVDAVVTVATTITDQQLSLLAEWNLPIVCAARPAPNSTMPAVLFDNRGGALKATHHLIEQGRRRILHLRGSQGNFDADERSGGFHEALKEKGVERDAALELTGDFTRAGGTRAMAEALDKGLRFDGLFAGNDDMAVGAMEEMVRRGVKIPDDVAVVGFDDIDLAHFVELSTVRVPLRDMGRTAARIAFELIEGQAPEQKTVLPTELVERASSIRGRTVSPLSSGFNNEPA